MTTVPVSNDDKLPGSARHHLSMLIEGDWHQRYVAATALAEIGPPVVPDLLDLLKHGQRNARIGVMETLELIGDSRAIPQLVEILEDPDQVVRFHAIFALGKTRDPSAVQPLSDVMRGTSGSIVGIAATALACLGVAAVPALKEILAEPPPEAEEGGSRDTRIMMARNRRVIASARALLGMKDPSVVPEIIQALDREQDHTVRHRLIYALGKIGGSEACDELIRQLNQGWHSSLFALAIAKSDLKEEFGDKEKDLLNVIADAVSSIGAPDAVPVLLSILRLGSPAGNFSLSRMNDPRILPELQEMMEKNAMRSPSSNSVVYLFAEMTFCRIKECASKVCWLIG